MTNPRRGGTLIAGGILLTLTAGLSGCEVFKALVVLWGKEPTREVKAEYPYLAGKKVAVVVWAEMDTLFEYPFVQYEIAKHAEYILGQQVADISFVPSKRVIALMERERDWDRKHPSWFGRTFDADRVLMIELTQYTTREPDSPHLYRGRIAANVKVYDSAYPDAAPAYRTEVETAYPPDSTGEFGMSDGAIRKATMEAFATDLAKPFYDRREKS